MDILTHIAEMQYSINTTIDMKKLKHILSVCMLLSLLIAGALSVVYLLLSIAIAKH